MSLEPGRRDGPRRRRAKGALAGAGYGALWGAALATPVGFFLALVSCGMAWHSGAPFSTFLLPALARTLPIGGIGGAILGAALGAVLGKG
jgi:hypothetical protein